MDIKNLKRHFEECELPITFVEEHPRPRRFNFPTTSPADDLCYVDVVNDPHHQEQFRMFVNERAGVEMLDKQPKTHHMLVLVRNVLDSVPRLLGRRFLMGHDERQLFVVNNSGASSVREALDALKPPPVRIAERRGLKVIRQGDWFFIPCPNGLLPDDQPFIMHRNERIGGPNALRNGFRVGHPHIAQEQALGAGVFVRGKIRHDEHATVKLQGWHQAVQGGSAPAIPSIGYFD